MLKRLKLRGRILAGYAVPVAIAMALAIGVATEVWRARDLATDLARRNNVATGMQNAAFKLAVNQRLTRGNAIAQGGDPSRLEDFRDNAAAIEAFIAAATDQIQDPVQAAQLADIRELAAAVLQLEEEINLQVMAGELASATAAIAGSPGRPSRTRALSQELARLIADFRDRQAELVAKSEAELHQTLQVLTLMTIVAAVVSAVAAIALEFAIAARITRSLEQTVVAVDRASSHIVASVVQQERAIAQQVTVMDRTTATVEQLEASSQQVAMQAGASATGAQQGLELVANGTQTVRETMGGMEAMQQQSMAIAAAIQCLNQQMTEISAISQLVEDISAQTHILSLNAAVEAARFGAQGAGFATIAQQIRALAMQSRQSGERIGCVTRDCNEAKNLQGKQNQICVVCDRQLIASSAKQRSCNDEFC